MLNLEGNKNGKTMPHSDVNIFLRKRYLVCFLTFVGSTFLYILRTNLSIAVVEMTSDKNVTFGNETITKKADFDWDSKTKGFVLSVFSFGYVFGPFGGMVSKRYGGVSTFGFGIGATALLTVLTPFLVRVHFAVYIFARVLEGLFESFANASVPDIFVRWAPVNERSRLLLIAMVGHYVGSAVNYPLSGFLAYHYGWEAVFYATGGLCLIWNLIWYLCVFEDPTTDRLMTQTERNYFESFSYTGSKKRKDISYPWKDILTSKPLWAYTNEIVCYAWSHSFLMFCIPLYINDVYHVNVQNIGFISVIPILGGAGGILIAAFIADYIRNRKILSQQNLHRSFIGIGKISAIIFMTYVGLWANFEQSIICMTFARIFSSFSEMSYHVMTIDVFCEYAGLAKGFAISATSLSHFLNPIIMGFIASDHSRSSWNSYFLFLNVFSIWSFIIFFIFGSGELQDWAKTKIDDDEKDPVNEKHTLNLTEVK